MYTVNELIEQREKFVMDLQAAYCANNACNALVQLYINHIRRIDRLLRDLEKQRVK